MLLAAQHLISLCHLPIHAINNFIPVPIAQEEERVANERFRSARVALESKLEKAFPLTSRRISKEFPGIGRGGTIGSSRSRAIFGPVPPLKHQFVRVAAEVAGMAQDDVLIENIVRKDRLDRAPIPLGAIHLDNVQRHRRATQAIAVVLGHRDIADTGGVAGTQERRICHHGQPWPKTNQRRALACVPHRRHDAEIVLQDRRPIRVTNDFLFQAQAIGLVGNAILALVQSIGVAAEIIKPIHGLGESAPFQINVRAVREGAIQQLFFGGGQNIRLQHIYCRGRGCQRGITDFFIVEQTFDA